MKIDSHHHFWKYDPVQYPWIDESMTVLRQDFDVQGLREVMAASGVQGAVSVQARQTVEESRWLLAAAEANPEVLGVVGWVPLAAEDTTLVPELDALTRSRWMKGVRHVVQDEPDDKFLLRNNFSRGISRLADYGLVYDILIFARQLPTTVAFVDRHPQQPFVLDHIGKPTIEAPGFDDTWAANLRQLAKRPNVSCKFSGVVTEVRDAHWAIDLIRPYWDTALEAFGPERLMFGSDWPVCLLRSRYDQWVSCVQELASELSQDERQMFWHANASRIYGLQLPENPPEDIPK